MLKAYALRRKEVININTAEKLGFIRDVEIDFETGAIDAVLIPKKFSLLGVFADTRDYVISWSDIVKVGREVILVNYMED